MIDIEKEVKKGIKIHNIYTNKFKTNLLAVFLATPLDRKTITRNALLTAILRRGTQNVKSQDLISRNLEDMYGASFDCGIEKSGDNQIMKFYLETISEEFLPQKEPLTKKSIDLLFDIILNPLVENNAFKAEYVESEKKNLKQIINSKIDNKRVYSLERCIEEMFKGEPYGLYKYGYIEDLEEITPENLYDYYIKLINECKIDIFVSGTTKSEEVNKLIEENCEIIKLKQRNPKYVINKENNKCKDKKQCKTIEEHMQVGQGNLVIGLNINSDVKNVKYIASVYNAILGGGANSKLFQNVREKASLAYTAGSIYKRQKNIILIRCGIEISNYEKALNTIKEQLEDLKKGKFTNNDIKNAKKLITETIISMNSEQDGEVTYYYGQELADKFIEMEEYIENISNVTKTEIETLAKEIYIDTIYFLRN